MTQETTQSEYQYELNPYGEDHDDWLIYKMIDGQQDYVGAACTRTMAELYCAAPALLEELEQARNVIRHAIQESTGRVRAEIVGGWIHHAKRVETVIKTAKGNQ